MSVSYADIGINGIMPSAEERRIMRSGLLGFAGSSRDRADRDLADLA